MKKMLLMTLGILMITIVCLTGCGENSTVNVKGNVGEDVIEEKVKNGENKNAIEITNILDNVRSTDDLDDFITSIDENEGVFINSIQNYDDENYVVYATICEPYIIPKTEHKKDYIVIDNREHYLFEVQPGEYYDSKVCHGVYKENADDIGGYYIQEDGKVLSDITECTMIVYKVTSQNIKFKMLKKGCINYTHVDIPLLDVFEIGKINNDVEVEKLFVSDYPVYQPIFENNKCISLIKCNEGH